MNVNETQCVENEVCMHNEITLYCILYECEIVQLVPAVLFDHVGQLNYKLALLVLLTALKRHLLTIMGCQQAKNICWQQLTYFQPRVVLHDLQ